jgi:predicted transcriptional regulator
MPGTTVSLPDGISELLEAVSMRIGKSKEALTEEALEEYLTQFQMVPDDMSAEELEAGYRASASDAKQEQEAKEWCEHYATRAR